MPTIQIETEQLLNAALQLPRQELERFLTQLAARRIQQDGTESFPPDETELLLKINQGLPPSDVARMKELIAKREASIISRDELQELILLTDKAERLNVERMRFLTQLAALRNVTLDELMKQLGIYPHE